VKEMTISSVFEFDSNHLESKIKNSCPKKSEKCNKRKEIYNISRHRNCNKERAAEVDEMMQLNSLLSAGKDINLYTQHDANTQD
jgi:hypothetical protein